VERTSGRAIGSREIQGVSWCNSPRRPLKLGNDGRLHWTARLDHRRLSTAPRVDDWWFSTGSHWTGRLESRDSSFVDVRIEAKRPVLSSAPAPTWLTKANVAQLGQCAHLQNRRRYGAPARALSER
jgi:hypothetical protein